MWFMGESVWVMWMDPDSVTMQIYNWNFPHGIELSTTQYVHHHYVFSNQGNTNII